jgi:putative transposase
MNALAVSIPFGDEHLRRALRIWQHHDTRARPHSRLGPGLPEPPLGLPAPPDRRS